MTNQEATIIIGKLGDGIIAIAKDKISDGSFNQDDINTAKEMAIKALSVDYEVMVKEIEELPHGEYKDDYGKGFSAAVHAVLKIVAEYIKI